MWDKDKHKSPNAVEWSMYACCGFDDRWLIFDWLDLIWFTAFIYGWRMSFVQQQEANSRLFSSVHFCRASFETTIALAQVWERSYIYIFLFIFILTAQILTADLWSAKKLDKYNSTYDTGFLSSHGMFPFFSTLCMHDFHSLCDFTIGGTHVDNRHCVSPWIQAPQGFRHSRTGRVHISLQQCKYKES